MVDWKAVQSLALASVIEADDGYVYRKICRLYSKTYSTPLPQVQSLPPAVVLRDFFEGVFEEMDEDVFYSSVKEMVFTEDDAVKEEELIRQQIAKWEEEDRKKNNRNVNKNKPVSSSIHKDSFVKFDMASEEAEYLDEMTKEPS